MRYRRFCWTVEPSNATAYEGAFVVSKAKILIIEDNASLSKVVQKALHDEDFEAHIAPTGKEALRLVSQLWDLIILDLMLPDLEGEAVLKYLVTNGDHPPVLVLTAKNRLEDKLSLFRQGCDDYLTKPFEIEELLERVRALLRRLWRTVSTYCTYEDMKLDISTYRLQAGEKSVALTPKESSLCHLLMREPGRVVSRREILHSVWGHSHDHQTNFLGVHLLNLRKKLAQLDKGHWLQTVRSAGFVLCKPDSALERA